MENHNKIAPWVLHHAQHRCRVSEHVILLIFHTTNNDRTMYEYEICALTRKHTVLTFTCTLREIINMSSVYDLSE